MADDVDARHVALGGADRAQQILGVQHADDVFRLVAPQRNAGVFGGQHLAHQFVRRQVGIDHHHRGAVDHDVGDGEVAEAEDIVNVFGLAAFDPAVHGGFLHQPFDLGVGEDFVLRGFLHAEQAQNPARSVVEQPVQRPEDQIGHMQRIGDPLRDRHRLPDRQRLRHLLADHDMQRGEHQEPGQERHEVQGAFRHSERDQQRFEQRRNGGFADPAEAERGHGDAELAAGEIGLDIAHHALQQARAEAVLLDHRPDAKPAALHQRKLGGHVERVGGEQKEREQQIGCSRTHACLATAPALRDVSTMLRPDNPVFIPTASVAGNREPAPARRRLRPPRGRSPAAG